jgi:hypothetical protein
MTRTLLVLAAASTLTLSYALAQQSPSEPVSAGPPTRPEASIEATKVQSAPGTGALSPSGTVTGQTADQWLASKFKGTAVLGPDDAKVGAVDDLLFDRTGSIKAVVVGVGGVLGIGSKQIALSLSSFDVVAGKDGAADQLKISMTKDQLAAAPEFKPYDPPRSASTAPSRPATTGSATTPTPPARPQQ